MKNQLHPVDGIASNPKKTYPEVYNRLVKVFSVFQKIILPVGQKQLMREMLNNTLNVTFRFSLLFFFFHNFIHFVT